MPDFWNSSMADSPQDQYVQNFALSNGLPVAVVQQAAANPPQSGIQDVFFDDGNSPLPNVSPPVVRGPSAVIPDDSGTVIPPGAQKEAESKSALDNLMEQMAAHRKVDTATDRNNMWADFFSRLASSKSNTVGGGIADAASTLGPSMDAQTAANRQRDYEGLKDQIAVEQYKQNQDRENRALAQTGAYQQGELGLKRQELELGKYSPVKDVFGNVTGIFDARTGRMVSTGGVQNLTSLTSPNMSNAMPSSDPQQAAQQILDEQGSPLTQVASRQDVTGRNQQAKAYRDAANGAKSAIQQLDQLNAQTGKYDPGGMHAIGYNTEAYLGIPSDAASARIEAEKASKNLANAFMAQNVGAKGSGIKMVEFDAGAVPNANMPDAARTNLINVNKNIANSQVQRAAISDMYPRLHLANVNTIMDAYEQANPPILPVKNGNGDPLPNPNWMPYKDWLKAGRPNTAALALQHNVGISPASSKSVNFNDLPE